MNIYIYISSLDTFSYDKHSLNRLSELDYLQIT